MTMKDNEAPNPAPSPLPLAGPSQAKRGIIGKIILFFLFLLLGAAAYVGYDAYSFMRTPGSLPATDVVISIPQGATFDRVAWELKKAGAIRDVTRFRWLGTYKKSLGSVKAGDFLVNTGWTPDQVLWQITSGQAILYRLTIREGLTWWETAKAVEAQGFATYNDFKAVIHDPAFLAKHNIPFNSAEGFLFPETYLLKKPKNMDKASAEQIASLMVNTFWSKTGPLWASLPSAESSAIKNAAERERFGAAVNATAAQHSLASANQTARQNSAGMNATAIPTASPSLASANATREGAATVPVPAAAEIKRLIILASLVEKETGVPEERAKVAGVYTNRLQRGMRLECDPTIIYGIGESFRGPIRRSQIQDASNLYNTYQHAGLPPGPICSSGFDAIKAAFMPEKHNYIFFVATGVDKSHTFSENLTDHNKAVSTYRSNIRSQQGQ